MSKDSQNPLHLNSLHSQMIYSTTLTIFSMVFGVLAGRPNLEDSKDMLHDCGSQSGVEWGSCDVETITVTNPNLTCGFFEIPLDYHNSSAGNGRIFVVKMNATLERRGTLFTNPGGPGGSGIDWVDSTGEELLNFTGGHYDIVSWDPRGVGPASIPGEVYCFDNMTDYEAFWNGTIELTGIEMTGNFTNQTDLDNLFSQASIMDQKYRELGQRCLQHQNGTYLKYIGTAATARDMAALADALDGPGSPVNYWGISYGSVLGSWFVNMFPERVGHFIIDGVVNTPALAVREPYTYWGTEIGTSDTVFDGFATGCALSGPQECNLTSAGQSGTDVVDYIQSVLITAHDATLANRSVPVTSAMLRQSLFEAMYFPSGWQDFANQILAINISQVAEESNHSLSPGFLTKAVERRSLGTISKREILTGVSYADPAILCSDSIDADNSTMDDVFNAIVNITRTTSPMFGAWWPVGPFYCPFWPVRAVERYTGPFNSSLANPILVIGNTDDPITPFEGAQTVAGLLGDKATLIRQNGFGHSSFAGYSSCVIDIVRAYMENGTLPLGDDTVCDIDNSFELFPGVTTAAVLANITNIGGNMFASAASDGTF